MQWSQESYQETFSQREDCKPSRRTAWSKCAFTRGYNACVGYEEILFYVSNRSFMSNKSAIKTWNCTDMILTGWYHLGSFQLKTNYDMRIDPSIQTKSDISISYSFYCISSLFKVFFLITNNQDANTVQCHVILLLTFISSLQ